MTERKKEEKLSKFTDAGIRNLSTTKESHCFIEGDGFGIRVYKSGGKVFFYQYVFDGKRRCLNLGKYDPNFEVIGTDGKKIKSLAYHRNKYTEAKNKVNKGIDPLLEKDTEKAERQKMPFIPELCSEYIEQYAKREKKSWEQDDYYLNKEIIPAWKNRKVSDIRDRDIKVLLDSISARGTLVTANRVRALIHKLFNYAVENALLIEINPCTRVKRPLKEETPKDRKLSEAEIKSFWTALEGESVMMNSQTRAVLKIILLTAQRPGEVIGMHEKEIAGHWWTLPPARTKNKKEHRVYLSDTVLELIGDYKGRGYIFPARKVAVPKSTDAKDAEEHHATENSLAFALRRNIKGQSVKTDKTKRRKGTEYKRGPYKTEVTTPDDPNRIGIDMFSPHDLRRTAATLMAAIKVPFESRERVLNHTLSKMDGTYNQHDFDDEKQMAMESLERKILSILTATESNVVSIQTGKKKVA